MGSVGVGTGRGTEGTGSGDAVGGRVGSASVGKGTGTEGRGGGLTAGSGSTVGGDSNIGAGARVGSPITGGLPTGAITPSPTSASESLAGVTVGGRAEAVAGDAVGTGGGPRRNVATVAPPSSAPASAIARAMATSRGQEMGVDIGAGPIGVGTTGSRSAGSRSPPFERIARATASALLDAPSLSNALAICQFTVLSEIPRVTAISLLVRPSATRSRISR
jgi:hypothetical protein